MCGRYNILTNTREFATLFGLADAPELKERYNVSPTQTISAIDYGHGLCLENSRSRHIDPPNLSRNWMKSLEATAPSLSKSKAKFEPPKNWRN